MQAINDNDTITCGEKISSIVLIATNWAPPLTSINVDGTMPSRLVRENVTAGIGVSPITALMIKNGITGINRRDSRYIFPFFVMPLFILIKFLA